MFSRCLLRFPQNRCEIHTFILQEESTQLFANLGFNLLAVSANLDWLALVPRIVKVLDLVEAEVSPAHPVNLEHAAERPGGEAGGQHPANSGPVPLRLGGQARKATKLAGFLKWDQLNFH